MSLDDLQQLWAAQAGRIDELIRLNRQLLLEQAVRPSLRRSRAGDVFEAVLALLCLLCTGSFIHAHFAEARFWVPGAAMHLWFIAVLVVAIVRFVRKGEVHYEAPVLVVQQQLAASQAFALQALRPLFVFGLLVWGAPFWIVAARAWFGWDVYAWPGPQAILYVFGTTVLLGMLMLAICAYLAPRLSRMPILQRFVRDLAGYNLKVAQQRLQKLGRLDQAAE
jgi:hypothetical protein